MNKWKSTLITALVLGIVAVAVTFTQLLEFSDMGQYAFVLATAFGSYVVWDMVLWKDVNTFREIVEKGNIAYALLQTLPALFALAAAISIG